MKSAKRMIIRIGLIAALLGTVGLPPSGVRAESSRPLRIALLPILDALPFYVAQSSGLFSKYGLDIQAVPVASALERDQLMQSGEVDGMLNDLMATANFNRDRVNVQSLIIARRAYPDFPLFRVIAAPDSGVKSVRDLIGMSVGISKNTVIEYVTDRLLDAHGLSPQQIVKKSVPVIPVRYQLLLMGKIQAATLPDPLAKSALEAGALPVMDDTSLARLSLSVLTFSVKRIRSDQTALKRFIAAWDEAAGRINQDPGSYRQLLLDNIRVPENVRDTYAIPQYPRRSIPDPPQWADVMDWMVAKGLLPAALPYSGSINGEFLPQP